MTLPVEVGEAEGVRVVGLRGDLDVLTAPRLTVPVLAAVPGARALALDLTAVPFCDSSGVRLVDQLLRLCAEQQVPLSVIAPSGRPPRRVLDLTGVAQGCLAEDLADAHRLLGAR